MRAVQLALALSGTGLLAAISVAAIGDNTGLSPERALQKTIVRQRVAAGLPATQPAGAEAKPAMTKDQILAAVDAYEADINTAVTQVDKLRQEAYNAKDLIRVSFITGKLEEMRQIQSIVQPVIVSIRQPGLELFVMQSKLSTIRQGAERIAQAAGEANKAETDALDATMSGFDAVNGEQTRPGASIDDPTLPPNPTTVDVVGTRPGYASPYR